ncbi:putative spc97 spc98 family protein [Golovinomyces cichoracearum]|uniref:Spindle pole body component n=1 Tax=Golovinomyces cichoracearum TaxID=62708 RepID=A0A420J1H5_9PEZI|nr:putative spc97 spc98 family protein [Golovinomyces cichoracearum]
MNNDYQQDGDVFQIPDLWAPSRFLNEATCYSSFLFSELRSQEDKEPSHISQEQVQRNFFGLPDSLPGQIPCSIPSPKQSAILSAFEVFDIIQEDEADDDYLSFFTEEPPSNIPKHKSWDSTDNLQYEGIITPYIIEAGPYIFDAAIESSENYLGFANNNYVLINSNLFSSSLAELGLGRNSVLFTWDEEKHDFVQTVSKLRISGFTGDTLTSIIVLFMECGKFIKSLQKYVHKCYSEETSPTRIALAHSVSTLLKTLQSQLHECSSRLKSIIRLKSLFEPVHSILSCFQQLTNNTAANQSDESLLSLIYEDIQILEHRTDSLRDVLLQILIRVSQPWLKFASEWLGLKPENGLPISINSKERRLARLGKKERTNKREEQDMEPYYILDIDRVPSFVTPDDARTMFEVGKSLKLLKFHHPDHLLARTDLISTRDPPHLSWNLSFHDIALVESKALKYEKDIKNALKKYSEGPSTITVASMYEESGIENNDIRSNIFEKPLEDVRTQIMASISLLAQPLSNQTTKDDLSKSLYLYLTNHERQEEKKDSLSAPPISLLPSLSFNPIIAAQARIVNKTCMRIIFYSHQLRDHLLLQKNFQLFGNGVFSSRLYHAIFGNELENTDYRQLIGLRHRSKDSRPQACSELHLSLMGILDESYTNCPSLGNLYKVNKSKYKSLPGELSILISDVSQEDTRRFMSSEDIEATDFIRLSYQPPPPLDAVITSNILCKYDQLFRFLLRIIRMLHTVSNLHGYVPGWKSCLRGRNCIVLRFCLEAHHFVRSVSSYFFDTGIAATWKIFETKLDQIEIYINTDEEINSSQYEGLEKLRDYHELVVNRIMSILLLRKRQKPALDLLEEIFRLILRFSKLLRERFLGIADNHSDNAINEMYILFKKKFKAFISVLKGLNEKSHGEKSNPQYWDKPNRIFFADDDLVEENTIAQLLIQLDMSGYYENMGKMKN